MHELGRFNQRVSCAASIAPPGADGGRGSAQTHRGVLDLIGHPELRKVKPDLTLGLARKSIRVARDAGVHAPRENMAVDVYVLSRDPPVPYELSMSESHNCG